jgi:hypothetical protein
VIYVKRFCFEAKCSEVSYDEFLGNESALYITVNLY